MVTENAPLDLVPAFGGSNFTDVEPGITSSHVGLFSTIPPSAEADGAISTVTPPSARTRAPAPPRMVAPRVPAALVKASRNRVALDTSFTRISPLLKPSGGQAIFAADLDFPVTDVGNSRSPLPTS
ncbi:MULTISPECIES: hypothetical protein [Kribbella]|uniref:hypothetical protein n=1 Tax=Kribbella TaxID=182639 RepID=UPI00130535F1|nr:MULTISPECIES: hypothetical protein [Kribbella]